MYPSWKPTGGAYPDKEDTSQNGCQRQRANADFLCHDEYFLLQAIALLSTIEQVNSRLVLPW